MNSIYNPLISAKRLEPFNPCKDRFDNFKNHYPDWEGTTQEFLTLENITPEDKIWVCVRVLPRELVEVFAIDRAFAAVDYAAIAAAYAAAYAAYAANAAAYAAAYAYENQLDALCFLIDLFEGDL